MQTIKLKFSGSVDVFAVRIDDKKVSFTAGEASPKVQPGQHALTWFVRGVPGSTYKLDITEPASIKATRGGTLDEDMKDAGVHWFLLKEEEA